MDSYAFAAICVLSRFDDPYLSVFNFFRQLSRTVFKVVGQMNDVVLVQLVELTMLLDVLEEALLVRNLKMML